MHDPIIIGCGVLGVVLGIIHILISLCIWKQPPDILRVGEVFVSTVTVYGAVRVCTIAWMISPADANDEEKLYILLAAGVLFWIFVMTVVRLFKRR